uniref:Asp-tRNA(Asn)/Glu-tRNA(Gln) amidotransferase subunit GatC n=1 Tax=Ignisphaera aggregans TaxID=334771 RepID=A0A7C4D075_9CREN
MDMNSDIIEYLENLVLIKFTEVEKNRIRKEIDKIIDMFNTLNTVKNLNDWEPLYHVHDISLPLREDHETEESDEEHEILKENTILINDYVKAPRTVTE